MWDFPPTPAHRHFKSIPNDKITADDARHFTKSVPVSGPNAESWTDALGSIAPLLRCDASWARFNGALDGMPDIGASLHPCRHKAARSLTAAFHGAQWGAPAYSSPSPASSSPTALHRVDPTTFGSFPSLPTEIRNNIWHALERPAIVKAYAYRFYTDDPVLKLIIWTPGTYAYSRDVDNAFFRDWVDMALYDVSRESQEVATRQFGRPSRDSLPFRSSVDELRVVVDGDAVLHCDSFYEVRCSGLSFLEPCGCKRQACRRCKNMELMTDPDVGILFAAGEGALPELVAPSAAFLNRIHRVTIDLANRDPYLDGESWPFLISRRAAASRHRELAASLRRSLPNLSTLTILVEPMRCETAEQPNPYLDDDSHDPKTTEFYHAERVFLLEALTSLVEVNHGHRCDGRPERCRCLPLPFPKLKRLVVRVDTREKLTYLCTFEDTVLLRSHFMVNVYRNVLVFNKGSLPLLNNCLGRWR
jgi:hypothetical protein